MEEGDGMQPLKHWNDRLAIDQETREEQAMVRSVIVKPRTLSVTYLNSMTSVPTKLATLMLANAMERSNTTLAVVRLKRTRVRRNFQNAATVGTSPTSPDTKPPNTRGGKRRRGRMSKRTWEKKKLAKGAFATVEIY